MHLSTFPGDMKNVLSKCSASAEFTGSAVLLAEGFSENYLIKLGRENNSDTFDVYVELRPEQFDDSVKNITAMEKALAGAMRNMIGIGPSVHLVPPKTIARSEGKAKRVIDERNLHD